MGHKVLVPLLEGAEKSVVGTESELLYCNRKGIEAVGIRTSDGFVVKKGSKVQLTPTPTCPSSATKRREQYGQFIDNDGVLMKDLLFNTPSGASDFVCFANTNGNDEWKNHNGVNLKDL